MQIFEKNVITDKGLKNITKMNEEEITDLEDIFKKILLKLKEINASYNFELFYSPKKENLHFHIEVCPRLAKHAGFERASGDIINQVSPEDAAKF